VFVLKPKTMPYPRFTVVTPSYNQAQYVGLTVRSVLLQRYPELEYIVMDGGSKDGTQKVLEPYADRFAYYVSEKDKGQADAIHRGFARSTGEIMGYLNSDDMLAPGALLGVAEFFHTHPDVDVVYSHRCTCNAQNRVMWYWILPEHSNYRMLRWDLIPQETCFWRRRIFEKCGNINPEFHFAMDYDLFARFMLNGKLKRLNRFLGCFRQHESAKTSTQMNTVGQKEIQRVWQTYGIRSHVWDHVVGVRYFYYAERHGSKYIANGACLPGALPGNDYDYDDVWGGLLKSDKMPSK